MTVMIHGDSEHPWGDRAADLARRFWRDGYVVISNFFAAADMATLGRMCRDRLGETPAYLHDDDFLEAAEVEVVPWFPEREGVAEFSAVAANERLIALTKAVLGHDWLDDFCMVMFSRAGSAGQAWHQDCPPDNAATYNLNRLVYTDDIDPRIGGELVVVPGSHRRGHLPTGDPHGDLAGQVAVSPSAGTLALVHGHCWHRVRPVGAGERFSINYRAVPSGVPQGITDVCAYRNMRYRFSTAEILERYD